jgi:hypothetical protein
MADKLGHADLMSLEQYARERPEFRARVLQHKQQRQIALGENVTLHFEDQLTMQYQVQEMLRIEKIFEPEGIREELDSYNPLIPDGQNWKATMLIEYENADERQVALRQLKGIEDRVWVEVDGTQRAYAIADEDMDRSNDEKTAAVHFLRFELDNDAQAALRSGRALSMGIDHVEYQIAGVAIEGSIREALLADLD